MLVIGLSGGFDPIFCHRSFLFPPNGCHDSAAALLDEANVVIAIEEERLNRIKHTNKAAASAISVCLDRHNITVQDLSRITIPWSEPLADGFVRRCYLPVSNSEMMKARDLVHQMFSQTFGCTIKDERLIFVPHHLAHAASAHYQSGFQRSLVVIMDGGGDVIASAAYSADGYSIDKLKEYSVRHALGLFYKHVTEFLGYGLFDEYKVMGLAPYGNASRYRDLFRGTYMLLPEGDYTISESLVDLLCQAGPRRRRGDPVMQSHKDIAAALQEALEVIVFHILNYFQKETGYRQLCLAGGVAHNCTLNGKILYSGLFDEVFVQPAAHDAGLALGGALCVYYSEREKTGDDYVPPPRLEHVYLGTEIGSNEQVRECLVAWKDFLEFNLVPNITERAAQLLADGSIIGWVQGRSEFGPRALGNRSILADPRPAENKDIINRMVKKREAFRPFAPAVLEEYAQDYFEIPREGMRFPFMTFVLKVREDKQRLLGATTHVDGTARIQTVSKQTNPRFWGLIDAFRSRTGVPVLLNTSFNNNAEPIVDSVNDAVVCFLTTDLHYLVIGDYLIRKKAVDRGQFLQLVPSLPAYCVLTQSKGFTSPSETRWVWELRRNYDERLTISLSPEVYRIVAQADGKAAIGTLLHECNIAEELHDGVITEVKELWSLRSIVLSPA